MNAWNSVRVQVMFTDGSSHGFAAEIEGGIFAAMRELVDRNAGIAETLALLLLTHGEGKEIESIVITKLS